MELNTEVNTKVFNYRFSQSGIIHLLARVMPALDESKTVTIFADKSDREKLKEILGGWLTLPKNLRILAYPTTETSANNIGRGTINDLVVIYAPNDRYLDLVIPTLRASLKARKGKIEIIKKGVLDD